MPRNYTWNHNNELPYWHDFCLGTEQDYLPIQTTGLHCCSLLHCWHPNKVCTRTTTYILYGTVLYNIMLCVALIYELCPFVCTLNVQLQVQQLRAFFQDVRVSWVPTSTFKLLCWCQHLVPPLLPVTSISRQSHVCVDNNLYIEYSELLAQLPVQELGRSPGPVVIPHSNWHGHCCGPCHIPCGEGVVPRSQTVSPTEPDCYRGAKLLPWRLLPWS